ncbi:DUF3817 domain-containing protein [Arcticibacter eurypsychrophilus]|uniref:DUF3817 domain-containing protein n=1 Tax=Arcticibacter eurypsychrophilus TaxID=1434752 RepID=UPI00084DBFCF|nr:DUF3817 domain-containing protein [Arcticibacter eurypsychrophilus]
MTKPRINALQQLRVIGITEGISYLFLLLIAMPLKYYYDLPLVVKYNGWVHGILFIIYIAAVLKATWLCNWSLLRILKYFIASLIPLATFILDKELRKDISVL